MDDEIEASCVYQGSKDNWGLQWRGSGMDGTAGLWEMRV